MSSIIKNFVDEAVTEKKIKETVDAIVSLLAVTMGPKGKNVIIQDKLMMHYMTKDGHTVVQNLNFKGDIQGTVLNFIQKISSKLNRTVGDGTTSSIVIASYLYKRLAALKEKGDISTREIVKFLKVITPYIEAKIKEVAKKPEIFNDDNALTPDGFTYIKKIATLSANNDNKIGELVAKAFELAELGNVECKISSTNETFFENSSGFIIRRGMFDGNLANDESGSEFKIAGKDIRVLMIKKYLNSGDISKLSIILGAFLQAKTPLLIVASGYDQLMKNFLVANAVEQRKHDFHFTAAEMAYSTKDSKDKFNDLAAFVGAKPVDAFNNFSLEDLLKSVQENNLDAFGKCSEIDMNQNRTLIKVDIDPNKPSYELSKRISEIIVKQDELKKSEGHIDNSDEIALLQRRFISISPAGLVTIYVGGDSEQEKRTSEFLIEDSIYAVKSAIRNGSVPAGNSIVPLTLPKLFEDNTISAVKEKLDKAQIIYGKEEEDILENNSELLSNAVIDAYKDTVAKMKEVNSINSDSDLIVSIVDGEYRILNLLTGNTEVLEDSELLNSAETDIEIFKTAVSIVSLLLDSAGFVSTLRFIVDEENDNS